MDWDTILFNSAAFISGLFVLEWGADVFIDNTAIVARRLRISETLVALLTAGAEWEELAVVVAAILQSQPSLGLGNVIGSSISNILGAFSLGLLFHPGPMKFDRSAKIYSSVLFLVTTVFMVVAFANPLNQRATGVFFLIVFAVYMVSICYGIYKGVLDAPQEDDDDSDADTESGAYDEEEVPSGHRMETSRFLPNSDPPASSPNPTSTPNGTTLPPFKTRERSLLYYTIRIILGFIALSISGYVLSHTASSLATAFNLSGTVLGITILAFATTLPEKFLSVLSGMRGHEGIVVASTAGSNIFLLTLCLGVIYVSVGEGGGNPGGGSLSDAVVPFEIWVAWASSAIFLGIVFLGGKRWMGGVLLGLYFAFIVLEFTVYRR